MHGGILSAGTGRSPQAAHDPRKTGPPVSNTPAFVFCPLFRGRRHALGYSAEAKGFTAYQHREQGREGIMNKNGITATLAVMAFAGVIINAVAPENNADISLNSGAAAQSTAVPALSTDSSATATAAPASAPAPTSDSLLSEVKVYPSF
jgi:hypothetical protein